MKAALRMIPVLTAEESLIAADRIACATGGYDKDARRQTFQRWQRQAGVQPARPVRATPDALVAMGIGVHVTGDPQT